MQKSGHMVLKGVNWVHNDKIMSNGLERSHFVHNTKFRLNGLELGHMVLKRINWVHNDKIRLYGLERSQLGTKYYNQVIWS